MIQIHAQGDRFLYEEFPDLARALPRERSGAGENEPVAAQESTIEVFDTTSSASDIYSLPEEDRERLLAEDYGRALATQFSRIIGQLSRVRSIFRQHSNVDVMTRSLVVIGQDPTIFPMRIIIPRIAPPSDSVMAKIRKYGIQQIARKLIRVHRIKKTTRENERAHELATLASAPASAAQAKLAQTSLAPGANHVQFPFPIVARTRLHSRDVTLVIPSNTSVTIESLYFARANEYPHLANTWQCISAQPHNASKHIDDFWSRDEIKIESANDALQIYDHLRIVFGHYFRARIFARERRELRAQSAQIDVALAHNEPAVDALAKVAQVLGIALDFTFAETNLASFTSQSAARAYWQVILAPDQEASAQGIARHWLAEIAARDESARLLRAVQQERTRLEIIARIVSSVRAMGDGRMIDQARRAKANPWKEMSPDTGIPRVILPPGTTEEKLLAPLTRDERALVRAKYDAYARASESLAAPCEHVRLVAELRSAVGPVAARAALSALRGAFGAESATQMIKCELCHRNALCPHVLALAQILARANATHQEEHTALAPFIVRIRERQLYYCRICGEFFDYEFVSSDDRDKQRNAAENQDVANMIYREILILQRHIRAARLIDQAPFHRAIARQIYPFIETIEARTSAAQTSIAEETNAKLRIYIAIYIYATCIVNVERFGIIFDGLARDHASRAQLARHAIDKIIAIENVPLSFVPAFTREVVRDNLIAAVGQLQRVAAIMPFDERSSTSSDYRIHAAHDPVFALLVDCMPVARKSLRALAMQLLPRRDAARANIYAPLFDKCERETHGNAKRALRGAPILIGQLRAIYDERLFDQPIDTTNRRAVVAREQFLATNSALCTRDEQLRAIISRAMTFAPTISITRAHETSFPFVPASITTLYDENGRAHKWTIAIIKSRAQAPARESASGPILLAPNEYVADLKCSVCNALLSASASQSSESVLSALHARELREDFYRFFALRCPEGDIHEFDKAHACKKCGLIRDTTSSDEYFAKYLPQFRERLEVAPAEAPQDAAASRGIASREEELAIARANKSWVYNYELILECADAFHISREDLQSIGAREGLTLAELADPSFVARVPRTTADPRVFALRATLLDIFATYRILLGVAQRNRIFARSMIIFVDEVRRRAEMTLSQLEQASAQLPSLDEVLLPLTAGAPARIIIRTAELFSESHKPREVVEYHLETICAILLAINKFSAPSNARGLLSAFARTFVARVQERENTTLKNEHVNINMIEGTKLADPRDDDDVDASAEEDTAAPPDDADIDDEGRDPFSLEAFDVEEDTDEDQGAGMRLGQDMGW